MFSYPSFDDVANDLPAKVLAALSDAAANTAQDLTEYRSTFPAWVAQSSERGLAGWIHDRLWTHLVELLADIPEVSIVDREPRREIFVGTRYRLRVKRHHADGAISTYLTESALQFLAQRHPTFEGLEEIHLVAGYLWEPDLRTVGVPVLSLRDGKDKPQWMRELPPGDATAALGTIDLTPTPTTAPTAPVIEINEPGKDAEAR